MPEWAQGDLRTALGDSGWIEAVRLDAAPAGTTATPARVHPGVIGVDVGGTKIRAVASGPGRPVMAERLIETDPAGGIAVIRQISQLCDELSASPLRAVAIACPGALDARTGRVHWAPNLPGWDDMDVVGELGATLRAPVAIDNDVLASAKAECAISGVDDLAFLALGTGIGLGLILDGVARTGSHGQAGEVCHLPLGGDPFDTELHHHGVLESRLAGPRIYAEYRAAGGVAGSLREAFDAPQDRAARDVLAATARLLALTVRSVTAVVDPSVVVLGGGIGSRPDVVAAVASELSRLGGGPVTLRRSLLGSRAAAVGALLAANELAEPGDPAPRTP